MYLILLYVKFSKTKDNHKLQAGLISDIVGLRHLYFLTHDKSNISCKAAKIGQSYGSWSQAKVDHKKIGLKIVGPIWPYQTDPIRFVNS